MTDNTKTQTSACGITRRRFAVLSLAAGLAATTAPAAQGLQVTETDVQIKTADGICDAVFVHPTTGSYPGIISWPEIMGLRPEFRDIGKRVAAEGYAVLLVNPFYRVAKAPVFDRPLQESDRPKVPPFLASVNAPGNVERDAIAFADFLNAQAAVNKAKKIGILNYWVTGSVPMRAASALSDRVGITVSLHGGGLVNDMPADMPAMMQKIKSPFYFTIAAKDDMELPDAKEKLKAAFSDVHVPVAFEVYPGTAHGWSFPDTHAYNKDAAERARSKAVELFKQYLG